MIVDSGVPEVMMRVYDIHNYLVCVFLQTDDDCRVHNMVVFTASYKQVLIHTSFITVESQLSREWIALVKPGSPTRQTHRQ